VLLSTQAPQVPRTPMMPLVSRCFVARLRELMFGSRLSDILVFCGAVPDPVARGNGAVVVIGARPVQCVCAFHALLFGSLFQAVGCFCYPGREGGQIECARS